MIYIYTYFIISLFITIMTAVYMKERFGHLTYFVEYIRMFSDEQTSEYLKEYTNEQIVGACLIVGFLLSPIIAVWVMFRGG